MSRCRIALYLLVVCIACLSCATPRGAPGALEDIKPNQRPDPSSDEADLWFYMDQIESRLKTSGGVITDPALNSYVRDMVCKLAPSYCADIRIYIVQTPHFNASMAPNGCMQVWTGLMLRAQNEAQLAYILGHEIAHYLRRHTVQQWRTVRNTAGVLAFFQLATACAGVGYIGDVAQLVAVGGIFAFSRDQEREADDIGFEIMAKAGYDPQEAPKIWRALMAEEKASRKSGKSIFFATHPTPEERFETLERLAEKTSKGPGPWTKGREEYVTAIKPFRSAWLREEVHKGDHAATRVLLERLLGDESDSAELHFFLGELSRLKGEKSDCETAYSEYRKALDLGDPPPEIYRSLGLIHWRMGRAREACDSFRQYLERSPSASDRLIIESYLNQLR